jgi:hypothetical protein
MTRKTKVIATPFILILFIGIGWFVVRHRHRPSPTPVSMPLKDSTAPIVEEQIEKPAVKWLFLGHYIGRLHEGSEEQVSISVFYEDGTWGRFTPMIRSKGTKLSIRCEEGCTGERGSWTETNEGELTVVSKIFVCPICPLLREDVYRRPITEVWYQHSAELRPAQPAQIDEVDRYELLNPQRLEDYQSVFLPLVMKDSGIIL